MCEAKLMDSKRKRFGKVAVLASALVVLVGLITYQASRPASGEDPSKEKNQNPKSNPDDANEYVLRLLIWGGYSPKGPVKDFEEKMSAKYGKPVKLHFTYAKSSDDFFPAIRERRVDVVSLSHHDFKDERYGFISKKLILPVDLRNLRSHGNIVGHLQRLDFYVSGNEVFGVPIAIGPYGLAYNTKAFPQPPTSWDVLWDPKLKGKYALGTHQYLYNVNITALALGYPRESINSFDALDNPGFKKKLKALATNAGSFWVGVDKVADLKGMCLGTSWGDSLSELAEQGEIWKMSEPKEGSMWWIDVHAITWALKDKPILKEIAEAWIDRSLQPDFQVDSLWRKSGVYPVTTNIADRLSDKEKKKILFTNPVEFSEKRILQQVYSQRDRNGMRALWQDAMKGTPKRTD